MTRAARIKQLEDRIALKRQAMLSAYALAAKLQSQVEAMEKELAALQKGGRDGN